MSRILEHDNDTDNDAFEQIRSLAGTEDTDEAIDGSPLFRLAESAVLADVADAALPSGRTHANRDDIVTATIFFTVSHYLRALDESETSGSVVKSETIGAARREYVVDASSGISKLERAIFFETEARRILNSIGATSTDTDAIATVKFKGGF